MKWYKFYESFVFSERKEEELSIKRECNRLIKNKIPETVDDRGIFVYLDILCHMRMVSDDNSCSRIYESMGDVFLPLRMSGAVFYAPVHTHCHPISFFRKIFDITYRFFIGYFCIKVIDSDKCYFDSTNLFSENTRISQ